MTTATLKQPRTPAPLRILLALPVALNSAALIFGGALTLLDIAARHTFVLRSSYADVRSLDVDATSGDIQLTSAQAGARLTVLARVTEGLEKAHTRKQVSQHSERPGQLRLHLNDHCGSLIEAEWFPIKLAGWSLPRTECYINYDIAVPAGISVLASSDAGDVRATRLTTTASVALSSGAGAGDLSAIGISAPTVRLDTDAGDVSAIGISAPSVRLDTGAGDVSARLNTPPRQLEASSGAGDVTLTVPDVTYDVHASSSLGTVSDRGLKIDSSSPRLINASSGVGDVTILTAH
jgi:hypothetical protein